MARSFSRRVLESFNDFIAESPPSQLSSSKCQCLADYILAWVKSGRGARLCKRDFATLQVASQVIAHYWVLFPDLLDYEPRDASPRKYVERRVSAIFVGGLDVDHEILNPRIFG